MPSCSQTCRRRSLHPPLPLQSANSPYHFCDRTYSSLFPPFFSRTRSSDHLTPRRHWCDPDILLLTNGNDSPQARFQPAGVCPLHHSIPLPDQNYFPFFAFSHPCSITQTIFLCHPPDCRRTNTIFRILTGGIPNIKTGAAPKDCAGSFFSLFMLPLRFLFLPSVSKKSPEEGSPPASVPASRQTPAAAL